jgi:hypothetical protein
MAVLSTGEWLLPFWKEPHEAPPCIKENKGSAGVLRSRDKVCRQEWRGAVEESSVSIREMTNVACRISGAAVGLSKIRWESGVQTLPDHGRQVSEIRWVLRLRFPTDLRRAGRKRDTTNTLESDPLLRNQTDVFVLAVHERRCPVSRS